MKPTSSSPGSRALSASLREVREARKFGLRELARALEVDPRLLSQWELGVRVPPVEEVARILGYLRVDRAVTNRILFLAQHVKDPNWLDSNPSDLPSALTGVMQCERSASVITNWSPQIIPGLLQTPDYARALLSASETKAEVVDARLVARLKRQRILSGYEPVRLKAIMSELAIREVVGEAGTMSDQIDHLLTLAVTSNISVRIVPADVGYHPGKIGMFALYDFPGDPSIVFLEHHHASAFVNELEAIASYRKLVKVLLDKALSEDASRELLREAAG
ncbi:Scr1 family TA system antitoxin-like transcriptional regulator [Amycolatopsis sp. A133]|uniref:helix-turn-helix domain-containing protein n=1 Tax=Amycolatopsis sp. A133 TaxID=3064472 RepID=UPI0027F736D9|nr:Scr1 family TA system antitoxin-like transcriptional regulator [Amycolatopsis sp. A133]MDQ7810185.1 Scr1 family TA system antitoxin-like transcriptional regulator [Amycolatopsis sp. A133]